MGRMNSLQILFGLGLLIARAAIFHAAPDPADNLTENATDEAEFRQGGIAQQLMSGYPGMGGLYGNNAGYGQYMAAASGATGGGSYVNMLRNLYRPPSMGLTDKVKHWVKSFMNRRQYVKPYYSPSMSNLQYSADEFGGAKPVYMGANGYKAISVPLRQLQKYYKPYYASGGEAASQLLQSPPRSVPGSAASASLLSYSPSGGAYASEAANAAHFSSGNSGLFSSGSDGSSAALFGNGAASGSNIFSSGSSPSSSNLFSGGSNGGLYTSGGGGSSNLFSSNEGASSALFSAAALNGGNIYGSAGNPSSALYHAANGGAGSSVYSMDGGNSGIFSSDAGGSSSFYSSGNNGASYGSSGAASGVHTSLNAGSSGGNYGGDLYASGASPSATVFNPNSGDQGRGYGNKKPSYSGASSSALYMSSDQRNSESYSAGKSQEPVNSFNVDSSGSRHQAEPSYSVSFQPAQGKSYSSSSFDSSGFQPVSFSSEEGYKGGSFQAKSS